MTEAALATHEQVVRERGAQAERTIAEFRLGLGVISLAGGSS